MKNIIFKNASSANLVSLLDNFPAKSNSEAQNVFEVLGLLRDRVDEYQKNFFETDQANINNPDRFKILENLRETTFSVEVSDTLYRWLIDFVDSVFEKHPAIKEIGLAGDALTCYFFLKEDLKNASDVIINATTEAVTPNN